MTTYTIHFEVYQGFTELRN